MAPSALTLGEAWPASTLARLAPSLGPQTGVVLAHTPAWVARVRPCAALHEVPGAEAAAPGAVVSARLSAHTALSGDPPPSVCSPPRLLAATPRVSSPSPRPRDGSHAGGAPVSSFVAFAHPAFLAPAPTRPLPRPDAVPRTRALPFSRTTRSRSSPTTRYRSLHSVQFPSNPTAHAG